MQMAQIPKRVEGRKVGRKEARVVKDPNLKLIPKQLKWMKAILFPLCQLLSYLVRIFSLPFEDDLDFIVEKTDM